MTESPKKRKRGRVNSNDKLNQTLEQTTTFRGIVDVNWQKLLASTLMMDNNTEKPAQDGKKHYTGTFRRARKKRNSNTKNPQSADLVQKDLKTLNISTKTNNLDSNATVDSEKKTGKNTAITNKKDSNQKKLTKFIAIDCEMVGIGYEGKDNMLARVSLVNKFGDCIYDKFVKPREDVIDYRTTISGVRKEDIMNGEEFNKVQIEVSDLLKGRILVGHSLKHDLSVLFLSHPKRNIRDTSKYKPFRKVTKGGTPSLKCLAKEILGLEIQHGEHSSVEDAQAAMQLYRSAANQWECSLAGKRGYNKKIASE